MDTRFALLDALLSMGKGNLLHRAGETAAAVYLAGAPSTVLILDDLVAHGWIVPVDRSGRRFGLSTAGRRALQEGAAWYRSLPLWRRLLSPRFTLPKPSPADAPGLA